ncbi:MAG: phosphatase PAP2 family protein, partial [Candidatus Thorarchaeota archaeon]
MFFDPNITTFLRDLLPWSGDFFSLVTQMGGELFIIPFLLIGFWAYRKRDAKLAAFILLVSIVTHYWLKYAIGNPRPPTTYWYGDMEASNYSTPSGHAQNAGTIYSWVAAKVKTWWMIIASSILILLVGISRVYLGVHFLGDVLLGWAIGILLGLAVFYFEDQLSDFASRIKFEYWYLLLFIIGFSLVLLSSILPYPPGDNFGAYGGLAMGVAVAFPLEARYVGFEVEQLVISPRVVARVVIGLLLVLGVMMGLAPFLPTTEIWLRAVRYFTVVFVGVF